MPVAAPPSNVAPSPVAAEAGITPQQLEAISIAHRRLRPIARAATIATISGWTMAFFAAISLLSGLFGLRALALGLALTAVAVIELRGARRFRDIDVTAPRMLAANQLALVGAVIVYSTWGIIDALAAPSRYASHIEAGGQMAEMLQPIDDLTRTVTVAVSATLIIGSILGQGSLALFYFTRRALMISFRRETPPWVIELIRA